jgi:hypothetical protein
MCMGGCGGGKKSTAKKATKTITHRNTGTSGSTRGANFGTAKVRMSFGRKK